jgi:hypothetical protein
LKDKCLYIALQSLMKKNHPTDVPFVAADVSEEIFCWRETKTNFGIWIKIKCFNIKNFW